MSEEWTLVELVGRVAQALAAAEVRPPNGRVTELPDVRMIRWYATIGLVDRPSGWRGRTALYGPRHLLQLVAIKRRQAAGGTLAEIQFELTAATDAVLSGLAALPAAPAVTGGSAPEAGAVAPSSRRFWAQPPAPAPAPPAPAPPAPAPPAPVPNRASPAPQAAAIHGLDLGGGALLLVPSSSVGAHAIEIRAVAQPLLDLLAAHGLLADHADDDGLHNGARGKPDVKEYDANEHDSTEPDPDEGHPDEGDPA